MSLVENFKKASEEVKKLKVKPNEDELLDIYALYKQAELGDCNIPKPGFLDMAGKVKWEAWNSVKGMSKEEAMEQYIQKANALKQKYGIN